MIHYKFKNCLQHDIIAFDGLNISVADLRKAIMADKKIGKASDFILQLTNAQTKKVYDKDDMLIPRNTSIVVARLPIDPENKIKRDRVRPDLPLPIHNDFSRKIRFDRICKKADLVNANVTEGDKVQQMITQSTEDYDPSKFLKSRNTTGPVPANYICFHCGVSGHWNTNCPLNNSEVKRSKGIPQSFMVFVDGPQHKGALLTNSGKFAVPRVNLQAYEVVKKEKKPFVPEKVVPEAKAKIPEEIICNICKEILQEAVLIPCCGASFCDECIRHALLESDNHKCPDCSKTDISPDTLIPNRFLRTAVWKYKNKDGCVPKNNSSLDNFSSEFPLCFSDSNSKSNLHTKYNLNQNKATFLYDRIEKMTRKKRTSSAAAETSADSSPKKQRNSLNDRMLDLYRKQVPQDTDVELIEVDESEELKKTQNIEVSKSCSKTTKSTEKKKSSKFGFKQSTVTFADIGGLNDVLKDVLKKFLHLRDPDVFKNLGITPIKGFLLHGPSGCGKTHLARAIAGELCLPYIEVAATELVCGISGESESKIREMFDEAVKNAPCILFIDEIDAISPKRETTERGMERRMVAQMLKCLDELNEKDISASVMVIGATNRPDFIDPALRRGGRFDTEFAIGMPDEEARMKILHVLSKELKLAPEFDMQWLAHHTPGYVGADLKSLITKAVEVGVERIYKKIIGSLETKGDFEFNLETMLSWFKSELKIPEDELMNMYFELMDFQVALQDFIPNSKREGFTTVPDVTWENVGALKDIKKQLQKSVIWPVKYRKLYDLSHMSSTKGILLYGPKGCGKTLLAKAIANECSINFLSVKGPELFGMYVGESEKKVRECFQRARHSAPCIIFFDEFDALCPTRSGSNTNAVAERVVNQLLTEMDGIEERKQVFVIGATNFLEKIDPAMLRPGRLDKIIYVGLPSPEDRVDILKCITKNKTQPKISDDVDLEAIGFDLRCQNFSGADMSYLVNAAFSEALEDHVTSSDFVKDESIEIKLKHFEYALSIVKPSVSEKGNLCLSQSNIIC